MDAAPAPARPAPAGAFTPGGLLLGTLRVWWRNALAFSAVSLLVWTPVVALWLRAVEKQQQPDPNLLLLFLWMLGMVSAGAIAHGVLLDLGGTRPGLPALLAMIAARLWPVFTVSALYSGTIIVGFFLFFVPAVFAALGGYVALAAAVAAPDLNPVDALRRSWILTQGHRLPLLVGLALLRGGAFLVVWAAFRYIAAAPWIPPVIGDVAFLTIAAVVDGFVKCSGPVAFHQLQALAPPGREPEPTIF